MPCVHSGSRLGLRVTGRLGLRVTGRLGLRVTGRLGLRVTGRLGLRVTGRLRLPAGLVGKRVAMERVGERVACVPHVARVGERVCRPATAG